MNIAIIPARGGSRRIERKNIRPFMGKPIIAYSIETAIVSKLFDEVYVSTEDAEIAMVAANYGAQWINRPPELAELDGAPDPGTQEVTRHAITSLLEKGMQIELACCIYATAPLLTVYDLVQGHRILKLYPQAAFAYGVSYDLLGPVRDAGQFYWGRAQAFIDRVPLDPYAKNVWKISMHSDRVIDINTESDWLEAERRYAQRMGIPA